MSEHLIYAGRSSYQLLGDVPEGASYEGDDFRLKALRVRIGDYVLRSDVWSGTRIAFRSDNFRHAEEIAYLGMVVRGSFRISMGEKEATLAPGDGVLLPGWEPFEAVFGPDTHMVGVFIPLRVMLKVGVKHVPLVPLERRSPILAALHGLIRGVLALDGHVSASGQAQFVNVLEAMLSGVYIENNMFSESNDSSRLATRQRIVAHLSTSFADPDISVDTVASMFGLSKRSLHRMFEGSGTSVLRELARLRTEQAIMMLEDPACRQRPIEEIRASVGFATSGQLRRALIAATGMSPAEYRRRTLADS